MSEFTPAPTFLLGSPEGTAELLESALGNADRVWRSVGPQPTFLESELGSGPRILERTGSDRVTAEQGRRLGFDAAGLLDATLVNREGRRRSETGSSPAPAQDDHVVVAGARLALRVPWLASAFAGSRFVAVYREPGEAVSVMLARWRAGRHARPERLDGWEGDPWSLPVIPGWRELNGLPLAEVVVRQWVATSKLLLDDLEALDSARWAVADRAALLGDPRSEVRRICGFLGLRYDLALLTPVEAAARAAAPVRDPELTDELLALTEPVAARWRDLLPERSTSQRAPAPRPAGGAELFSSQATPSFPNILDKLQSSLLISTYQSGRLICARVQDGRLNTHFRSFDKPMGLAVQRDRFALATRAEVWDFRDYPAVVPKLTPPGHDACYLPRNRHMTGDALMHEMVYVDGELWGSATKFSCLVSFDADTSFVPRWRPSFIKEVAGGDRCHLNGICLRDGQIAYVSALGTTDEPRGWHAEKATGGVLLDVASGEVVCAGLSMPHSPRMHDGEMYVLESGHGSLNRVDLATGRTERLVELSGFTRGLAFAGRYAFIGLSQIRESSTFGDLPITQRLQERVCGVWVVDLEAVKPVAFLKFDGIVQEIFDVQLMPGVRFPEIAEPGSSAAQTSFQLP